MGGKKIYKEKVEREWKCYLYLPDQFHLSLTPAVVSGNWKEIEAIQIHRLTHRSLDT